MYEGSLCVCCMSTDDLIQLFVSDNAGDGSENNYAKMLCVCLRIPVSESDGHDSICGGCARRLKDCLSFKRQALQSISILSSIELSELATGEELSILRLGKSDHSFHQLGANRAEHLGATPKCAEYLGAPVSLSEAELPARGRETGKGGTRTEEPCGDSGLVPETDQVRGAVSGAAGDAVGGKRRVGRPRVHSPGGLPYRVERTERACRECGQVFPTHLTLKIHYNCHFGRHACAQCGARFLSRAGLRKHARAHDTGPFRCDVCPQEFRKVNTLQSHKRYKHGARPPYRCAACGARFRTLHARLRHAAAAHAPPPRAHACAHCAASFRTAGERSRHVRSRHSARVACAACGARLRPASLAAHLRTHTRAHAAPRAPTSNTERRWWCRLCGASFTQKHSLLHHAHAHARRGHFAGAPQALVRDARGAATQHTGLLSDADEIENEESDESKEVLEETMTHSSAEDTY